MRLNIAQLNALINMQLGELTPGDHQNIMTICTIDEHARDVVATLIAQKHLLTVKSTFWQCIAPKIKDCAVSLHFQTPSHPHNGLKESQPESQCQILREIEISYLNISGMEVSWKRVLKLEQMVYQSIAELCFQPEENFILKVEIMVFCLAYCKF
ncbi:uncharacterized protein FYW23_005302 isoform 1-T2 [Sylvia borin]